MGSTTARSPQVLDREECVRRLRHGYTGRVGFVDGGRPQVLPVNYAFTDGAVMFQTGPGAKFDAALREDVVAFEIDGIDVDLHAGWSVIGPARTLTDPDEVAWANALPLRPWAYGGRRPFWVRIDASEITGRRFG